MLSSCGNKEEGKYEIKNIDIYRETNKVDKQIGIRFYAENPHVPYIGINQYFKEFYNIEFSVAKTGSSYLYKKKDKDCIKLDTFDNLRGYTTRLVFGCHNLQTIGLDTILENYYPDIKKPFNIE